MAQALGWAGDASTTRSEDGTVPDTQAAGEEAPAFTMPLERGKIREFAVATGSSADEYLTDPYPVIPPTFLRTAAFWTPPDARSLLEGIKLDLRRVLHGEQEYTFFGPPPRAGAELAVTQRLGSVTRKQGKRGGEMLIVEIINDFADESGKVVVRSRQTLIQTGKAPA
jgi:hypothetical protein